MHGQCVVITGYGPGLGESLKSRFEKAGARVIGVSRNTSEYSADMTQAEKVIAVFDQIRQRHAHIDLVIHNVARLSRGLLIDVDAAEFECPLDLRLDRKAASRHLSFSAGPRVCPGAGISRLEQQIAWTRLLERCDSIRYGTENAFLHQPGIMLGTLELNLNIVKSPD